jgi:hypothetical protein
MTELAIQLEKLIEVGDEKAVRAFVIEHIKEFPEETRNQIIFAFFTEAMENDTKAKQALAGIIGQGLDELKQINKDLANLGDKKAILDVQKKIQGIK